MYVTTPTNIWAWQQAITIALKFYGCSKANIECRTLLIVVSCLWLTYSTLSYLASQLHTRSMLHYSHISQVKVQHTATPI